MKYISPSFFQGNRTTPPEWVALNDAKKPVKISRPFHSNAYLDLDGDGNSDLFVTAEDHFEVWLNDPQADSEAASADQTTKKVLNYSHAKDLVVDGCHDYGNCILGQVRSPERIYYRLLASGWQVVSSRLAPFEDMPSPRGTEYFLMLLFLV